MKNNISLKLLLFAIIINTLSCEKSASNADYPYDEPYVPYHTELTFYANGHEYKNCGVPFTLPSFDNSFWIDSTYSNYGKFYWKSYSVDNCNYPPFEGFSFQETLTLSISAGYIEPKLSTYDLKNTDYVNQIKFSHWGNNIYNNNGYINERFDKIIEGQLQIDSVLFPNDEDQTHGKVLGTFWVTLGLSDMSLDQGVPNDTMELTDGKFIMNIY